MKEQLNKLSELVEELKTTNSVNSKKEILAKYPECKNFLFYTYNPLIQFGVTSKNLKKLKHLEVESVEYENLFDLLDDLAAAKLTGHKAVAAVNKFINKHNDYKDLLYNIIDRNLKIRVKASLINKVYPELIPEFKVSLAKDYEDFKHKVDFDKDQWFASRKLDGVRCIAVKDGGKVDFFSRQGKPFHTLEKVAEAVKQIPMESFILDGEVCIINENDEEDFTAIVSEIRRKDHTIEFPKYKVFDFISHDSFLEGQSELIFSDRIALLSYNMKGIKDDRIEIIDQYHIHDLNAFEDLKEYSIEKGWEGLILRKDIPYEGKRTNNMLKVKQFFEDEFVVKDIKTGPMRHIIDVENNYGSTTKEVEDVMMTKAVINYKGYNVDVGSGWSMDERIKYYNNPELLIGKTITVQYFGESTNNQGGLSLRFPTVKYVYAEGRDL